MLASMFKKRAVPGSASKAEQADRPDADRPLPRSSSDSSVINGLLNAHPNLSMFRNKANRSLPASSTPVGSPTPAGRPRAHTTASRTNPQRPSVKGLFLHRNRSMESLTSPVRSRTVGAGGVAAVAADDADDDASFYTPGSKAGRTPGREDLSDWENLPASPSIRRSTGASPYLSPYKASRSSPDVSGVGLDDDAVEAALRSFHHLESVPLGTPASKRGILRDPGRATPASGSSVRFFSRDNVHVISPPPSTVSDVSSPAASSLQDADESEDLSMATGVPAMGSPIGHQEPSMEPSFYPAASQMPATPLQGPGSRSFLAQLQGVSPATPDDTSSRAFDRLAAVSTTPSRSPAVRQPSPLTGNASAEQNASRSSTLLSLDMLEPPVDMSNLRDTTGRLPDNDQATFRAGDGRREMADESAPLTPASYDLPTPTSMSFPYVDLESSTRSNGRRSDRDASLLAADGCFGDSTETAHSHAEGDESSFAPPERSRLATQSSFSSVLDFYSHSPQSASPAVPPPTTAPASLATATTPRKGLPPTSDSCGDLTVYHTPRVDLQLRILQMELESPMDGSLVLADPDRSMFDPEASFSRSLVDRGLSPGQPGSPSLILSFLEGDSVDYAPSSPLTPSLMASFPRAPSPGRPVLVPTSDVAALNAEFYQSHRELLAVTQKKYDLQVEIAAELESTLRRKETELRTARSQIDRMGEVRDLEVRLEMQRHDAEQARLAAKEEASLKDEALACEAAACDRVARLEAEVRDLQIKGEAASTASTPVSETVPGSLEDRLAERDDAVDQLEQQVAAQQAEIKRLAARLIDSALEKDAALGQISALEQDAVAQTLLHEALEGKVADRERVIERLEAQSTASAAESTDQLQDILASHHREATEQRAQVAALEAEVDHLQSRLIAADPVNLPMGEYAAPSTLVIALAAARRDLDRLADQTAKDAQTITMHQDELDHQWKRADETHDELVRLRQHRDQLAESLLQTDETIDGLQADLAAVQDERDALLTEREELLAERDDALAGNSSPAADDWAAEREELVAERDAVLTERDAAWEEREELLGQLDDHSQALADKITEVERLTETLDSTTGRHSLEMEELKRVRAANADLATTKDRHLAKADSLQEELARLTATLDSKTALVISLQARLDEADAAAHSAASAARETLDNACHERERTIRSLQHELADRAREASALERDRADLSRRFDGLVAEHASRSIELQTSSFRSVAESGELERLTKQIAHLKAEDAAKEVRILHLLRSRDEVRETLEGVEIALDSKQQELELVKRRFGVKGVGGCTPATNRTSLPGGGSTAFPPSASAVSRRHSVAPATPSVAGNGASSRLSLGGMPETPGPLGRPAAARPRSSLAMGTPGLKHVPGSSTRSSVGGRPRSSAAAGDLSASTSSTTAALAAVSVPTPSTASRASSARAAAAAAVAARLSASTSSAQDPPTPFGRTTSRRVASSSSTAAAGRPLAESNATPRRSSFAPASAGKFVGAGSQPTPRRSLSTSASLSTPGGVIKARRLSNYSASTAAAGPATTTQIVFPSVVGVAEGQQLDSAAEDKENVAFAAPARQRESSLLA